MSEQQNVLIIPITKQLKQTKYRHHITDQSLILNLISFFETLSKGNYLSKVLSVETCSIEKKDFPFFEIKF